MHFVRKVLLWVMPSLFRLVLVGLALSTAAHIVFSTPDKIKSTLEESNAYSTAVDGLIKEIAKSPENKSDETLPLDQPEIQQAIKEAFSPAYLKQSTESVVDGFYAWLQGKTPEPTFAINVGEAKQKLGVGIGNYIEKRLLSLPPCSVAQLRELQGQEINPFTVPCLPPGLNIAAEKQKLIQEFVNNKDFLGDEILTAEDLGNREGNQSFTQQFEEAPQVYRQLSTLPWLLGGASLVLALLIVMLSFEKKRGIRLVGMSFLTTGIFLLISTLILWFVFKHASSGAKIGDLTDEFQGTMLSMIHSLAWAFNKILLVFGGIYTAVGTGVLLALRFWHGKQLAVSTEPEDQPLDHATAKTDDSSKNLDNKS